MSSKERSARDERRGEKVDRTRQGGSVAPARLSETMRRTFPSSAWARAQARHAYECPWPALSKSDAWLKMGSTAREIAWRVQPRALEVGRSTVRRGRDGAASSRGMCRRDGRPSTLERRRTKWEQQVAHGPFLVSVGTLASPLSAVRECGTRSTLSYVRYNPLLRVRGGKATASTRCPKTSAMPHPMRIAVFHSPLSLLHDPPYEILSGNHTASPNAHLKLLG